MFSQISAVGVADRHLRLAVIRNQWILRRRRYPTERSHGPSRFHPSDKRPRGSCHAACCVPRREITIHVDRRDYVVRAESAAAANEWKKVILETLAKYKVRRRAECTPCRTMPGRMARSSIQLGILLWLHAHAAGARGVGARATQSRLVSSHSGHSHLVHAHFRSKKSWCTRWIRRCCSVSLRRSMRCATCGCMVATCDVHGRNVRRNVQHTMCSARNQQRTICDGQCTPWSAGGGQVQGVWHHHVHAQRGHHSARAAPVHLACKQT